MWKWDYTQFPDKAGLTILKKEFVRHKGQKYVSVDLIKRSFVISVLILEKMGELVWVSVYEILEIMLQQRYETKIYNSVTYVNFQFEKWDKVGYFVY